MSKTVKMVRDEEFRLATTSGHVIHFMPGEERDVPSEVVPEAKKYGARVIGAEPKVQKNSTVKVAPEDPDELKAALDGVFDSFIARNEPGDFSGNGFPSAKRVSEVLGYSVQKEQVALAWKQYKAEHDADRVPGNQ